MMDSKSDKRIISSLFCVAVVLMSVAFATMSITMCFASSGESKVLNWSVSFGEAIVKDEPAAKNILTKDNKVDVSAKFKELGETLAFVTYIQNNGEYDAKVMYSGIVSNLNDIVGTSEVTNKTYYLRDYVQYSIKYGKGNLDNNIETDEVIKVGDKLNKNTQNEIIVMIKLTEERYLTEDQKLVLRNYPKDIEVSMSIIVNYQEV